MPTVARTNTDLSALRDLNEVLGLEWAEIAATVGVDQSTLYRWRQRESSPRPMALSRLAQLNELLELLRRMFAGPDLARDWLRRSKPAMLGGSKTPLEVMREGRVDRVLTLLHFLARGA